LETLGVSFRGRLTTFTDLVSKSNVRREELGPEMRNFKQLDEAGRQAGMDQMFKNLTVEVSKLTCLTNNLWGEWQRFEKPVNDSELAVAKLEARMKKEMLQQVADLAKDWERQAAATSCWVEVYDKDPYDKTAVRLRCGYIRELGNMLEQLCALLPLEEWDSVYCCSPGQYWSSTNIFGYNDKHKTRMEVEDILEARNKLVFHNDSEADKMQLVIVRR
jgi:hypothetical protein